MPTYAPLSTPHLLAIESSCDDTAIAVMHGRKVIAHVMASQAVHATYGGVVPEYASRAHQRCIVPLVEEARKRAAVPLTSLDAIAFTQGPGLLGSLLVGASFAKGLAYTLSKPLVGIHHLRAHLLANFLEEATPPLPALGLIVSGGHTQLLWVEGPLEMEVLGTTRDDAVGEAFDKMAGMLGFPYPGGKALDAKAQGGDPTRFALPIASMPHLDFSFSGVKTALRYLLERATAEDPTFVEHHRHHLCASVQATLVKTLTDKVAKAMDYHPAQTLLVGGGVAANSRLRAALATLTAQRGWHLHIPPLRYCVDNAAMIGIAAHYQLLAGHTTNLEAVPMPRMPLGMEL